jgi:hypothetical protein
LWSIYAQHKASKVAANEVDDKLQREISVVAARRIKPPPQVVPEQCSTCDHAQTDRDVALIME